MDVLEDPNENFLAQVLRFGTRAKHAVHEPKYPLLVEAHQLIEGLLVTRDEAPNEQGVLFTVATLRAHSPKGSIASADRTADR
jgi:hypothetical protein